MIHRMIRARSLVPLALVLLSLALPTEGRATPPQDDAELEELLRLEREDADQARRRGELRRALRVLDEHLDEEPGDAHSRTLRALCRADQGRLDDALEDARRALADAAGDPELERTCARNLAQLLLVQGEASEAVAVLDVEALDPSGDARDAWVLGSALWAGGERDRARDLMRAGMDGDPGRDWERLLARARCERRLGFLERASRSLVAADAAAEAAGGREADVLVELGHVYFEADGEVDHKESRNRSPAARYKKALDLSPGHEGALLGLFELHRFNWNRQSRSAHEILQELLQSRPKSVEGLIAGCSADLDDNQLLNVRRRLGQLRELSPKRREVRTLEAALAWVEHRRDDCHAMLAELATEDAADATPERELARHLNELYRFAEAVPFARAATERDPSDVEAWTQLGRCLANTGDEEQGLAALQKATDLAAGRQNAWRHNLRVVLERMQGNYTVEDGPGELSYAWSPAAAEVLGIYLKPFYAEAREELSERYGFTPGPVHIEVFERHRDFSVRSTGFEGFPALGVCFGPVVTAVSPLSEMRGQFSWARTSFHEFTHVVHLGLSHNRCPRWITEGLATWEEEQKSAAWSRNMRRDLVDALANRRLIPVRELNRAFRGPRILFGYYQGGLLCEMLIDEHGFPPMIRLLEAFDRGLDLDRAFDEVFGLTPEQVDRAFEAFVRGKVRELRIEPRWIFGAVARRQLSLEPEPPAAEGARRAWAEAWCDVAWGLWQGGKRVDAEQALRRLESARLALPRASFLRGEIALADEDRAGARELLERGIAQGGDDFRARMALGGMAVERKDWEAAEQHFLAAERCFPGFPAAAYSPELSLANLYGVTDRVEEMQRARERWLAYDSKDFALRMAVGTWHAEADRHAPAERWFREANEIDPFDWQLHWRWGTSLAALDRHAEAEREFRVALLVPPEMNLEGGEPLSAALQAELLGRRALSLLELGRAEEAAELAEEALEVDASASFAREALERLQ